MARHSMLDPPVKIRVLTKVAVVPRGGTRAGKGAGERDHIFEQVEQVGQVETTRRRYRTRHLYNRRRVRIHYEKETKK